MSNIEKLVDFINENDEDGRLFYKVATVIALAVCGFTNSTEEITPDEN